MVGPMKSILKTPTIQQQTPQSQEVTPRYTERHRQIAIHHATLIQQQKDIETQIFEAIEELIEYPSRNADPRRPSACDVSRFTDLVAPFQLSDYDSLIEERNAIDKCGYVFCPRPRPLKAQSGMHSVIMNGSRGRDFEIVSLAKATMFCDTTCAKRAMFIKVQLSETPAWERAGGIGNHIEVMREEDDEALEQKMSKTRIDGDEDANLQQAMDELALERGELKTSIKGAFVMSDEIKENTETKAKSDPDTVQANSYMNVDGYAPKSQTQDTRSG